MGDTSETNTKVLSRELFLGVVALKRLYRKFIICATRTLFPGMVTYMDMFVDYGNLERFNLSLDHFPQQSNTRARCVMCNRHGMRYESWTECSMCKVSLCGVYTNHLCSRNYL